MSAWHLMLDEKEPATLALSSAAAGLDIDAICRELSQRLVDGHGRGLKLNEIILELARDIRSGDWRVK
jgi:hypothetical protein